jgi:molybdenum cofactor synthesis domain-containing protein
VRPILDTISLDEAMARLLDAAVPIVRTERVHLRDANGRVIAHAAASTLDVPPFDRAAMDGFAVIAEDTRGAGRTTPITLRVVETIHTGDVSNRRLSSGECAGISTGAPLPPGADAVVMIEETTRSGDDVRILSAAASRQHVSARGCDIRVGQALVEAGGVLNPSRIGALAAVGIAEIDVYARPRVAIVSTGNEIVEPGQPLRPGHIYDINRYTLSSIIDAHGGVAVTYPSVGDRLEDLAAAVSATDQDDVLILSGGTSMGERDLVQDLLRERGEVIFHGIAVKPGKPTMFGTIGRRLVLGMPGNPTSCLSNAYILLVPLLRRIARLPEYQPHMVTLPLARRIASTAGRHQFYTVRVADGTAVPAFKASGDITSMSHADGYIEIPAQTDSVDAGALVVVKLF